MPSSTETSNHPGAELVTGASVIGCKTITDAQGRVFHATDPTRGTELATDYFPASDAQIDHSCVQAWEAFHDLQQRPPDDRAQLLHAIASEIIGLGEPLLHLASAETGLGHMRLLAERDRTTTTLAAFAELVREGGWVNASIDLGDSKRKPVPKPDLRRMLRPLGPVVVFGAANFPLAYSTGGGDTASALAAGCPVIVKGHPAHPGTGEAVAHAIAKAIKNLRMHPGTFSFLHAGGQRVNTIGERLVLNPCVRAVGFTGSINGGMAIAELAASRTDPIPVFAEMGSTNPVFVLPKALAQQGKNIAERLYTSVVNSAGQMCTCPGLIFVPRADETEGFIRLIAARMDENEPMPMLSAGVRSNFVRRLREVSGVKGVDLRGGSPQSGVIRGDALTCSPVIYRTTLEIFRDQQTLHEECFGPATIVVVCEDGKQLAEAATLIQGSLVGSIFAAGHDAGLARQIQTILEQRVGRIVYNGVPTGVEPCASMVHGGPFPATNQPHSTAVGPYAIERWCRPMCYQNAPEAMLPTELHDANPLRIRRLVDGVWSVAPI